METQILTLKKTPLHELHKNAGAKMAAFGGWDMPIVYTSILEEHKAVREGVGMFDVSHMGQVFVGGPDASKFLNYLLTNEISAQPRGAAIYAHMLNEEGGVIDDLIAYRFKENMDLLVVNASRIDADWSWIQSQTNGFNIQISNESPSYGIIAIQGPAAIRLATKLNPQIAAINRFRVLNVPWENHELIVARTGYTGEDGVEFITANEALPKLWDALEKIAKRENIAPFALCGLGARDTLRLEAGYPLWGHELNEKTTPLEASYEWVVKWKKPSFIGKKAIEKQKEIGLSRKIFGFTSNQRGPMARQGCLILDTDGQRVGIVTSGSFSPTLNKPIAMGFLNKQVWGQKDFQADVHGRMLPISVCELPFYKRGVS